MTLQADIGIIGGSGFYSFLTDPEELTVETPFGPPSAAITVGEVAGRRVAFLPRHGARHQFQPHRVNYRANLWGLRSLGVRQVLGPCAVGSLKPDLGPGTFVVPDQLVDRTSGRPQTIYDAEGPVVHITFADPYCPRGRDAVLSAAGSDEHLVDGGTLVVVNGPRFSTRAESTWHAAQGWSIVGMTGAPEASIARELALCYTAIGMVTDHDAGIEGGEAVTHADVLRTFASNVGRLKELLYSVVARLPEPQSDAEADCSCRRSLDEITLPFALP
ncbi:S-methyl-5'-thioadenosine phosphorylase [Microlunatus panaciterrae]|uniref:Purine nucleoside phosphorylase n=1 Tax=Microlunatus panaciterrae TaxID=400768 RepID=A0ABS2RFN1_9ACTN|nr:S-methyl-5'-thioadenosine phosphorylase [Microlunatus panaciterrae]MBM7797801.1 5'-methylthioadenosine phosphorylase [Microlunatus panaciterrae]